MKVKLGQLLLGLLMVTLLVGCSINSHALSPEPQELTTSSGAGTPQPGGDSLFLETGETGPVDTAPFVTRYRFVRVDLSLLVDNEGLPLPLEQGTRIMLNLFPDLTYTGILTGIQQDELGISWFGTLEGIEFSEMTIVYTGDVLIAHIASPQGVYEVSSVGDGLYRVVQIDQNQLPGGEG
jgi:hypothetical protein